MNGVTPQQQQQPPQVQGINLGRHGAVIFQDIVFSNGQVMRIPIGAGQAVQLAGNLVGLAVDAAQAVSFEHAKGIVCPDCVLKLIREEKAIEARRAQAVAAHKAGIEPAGDAPPAEGGGEES